MASEVIIVGHAKNVTTNAKSNITTFLTQNVAFFNGIVATQLPRQQKFWEEALSLYQPIRPRVKLCDCALGYVLYLKLFL